LSSVDKILSNDHSVVNNIIENIVVAYVKTKHLIIMAHLPAPKMILRVRKPKSINQDYVAQHLGKDRTHITKTETFVRRLDFIELCDWLEAMDYDLGDFLRETGRLK